MDINKIIDHWLKTSDEKWETAQGLMKLKRYSDALFFCHLTLEALLKASVVFEERTHAPYTHDLADLARLSNFKFSSKQINEIEEITTFNIKARYDDYKRSFYKKATKSYTEKYFRITKELYLCIRKNIQPKK